MQGSEFHAYIDADCYPTGEKSAQLDPQNSNTNSLKNSDVYLYESLKANKELQISIYPNPSKPEITIVFPMYLEGNFEIMNTFGKQIQKNSVSSDYKTVLNLESGIYFLHYQSNLGHKLTKQIIIL